MSFIDFPNQVGSGQRGLWSIREEARKFWDHCTSDEAVYVGQPVSGNSDIALPFSELYLRGDAWLEVEVFFVNEWNTHLHCILEAVINSGRRINGHEDGETSGRERDRFMLVEVAKKLQLPESVILRRATTIIRLKQSNFSRDGIRKPLQDSGKAFSGAVLNNREEDISRVGLLRGGESQIPGSLIQSGTETIQKFPEKHSNDWRKRRLFCPADVPHIFKIVSSGDSIGFPEVDADFPIEFIKVHLRPAGLHLYTSKPVHAP